MVTPYTGEIKLFAGNFAPYGWAFCDGSTLKIDDYQELYLLYSTMFGGDGQTTFGLPDLRDRLPIGIGQGPGLTPRHLGEMGGEEDVTLQVAHLPKHNHGVMASNASATTTTPGPGVGLATPSDPLVQPYSHSASATGAFDSYADATIGNAGAGQPHGNLMPSVGINYIVALQGVHPSP